MDFAKMMNEFPCCRARHWATEPDDTEHECVNPKPINPKHLEFLKKRILEKAKTSKEHDVSFNFSQAALLLAEEDDLEVWEVLQALRELRDEGKIKQLYHQMLHKWRGHQYDFIEN